jgi:amino acid transporter/mannitol/fructose-specific phosphotransferase system IIA component (Ntr-type)
MALQKELNLLDVFSITIGAVMSTGIFLLPGLAYAKTGPAVLASYFLAGLLAAIGLLNQAELVSAMPKAGDTYFYVTRSMGMAVGTVYGLITLTALSLKSAFELIAMAVFTSMIVDIDIRIIAITLCLIFLTVNLLGAKGASRIQTGMVAVILISLAVYFVKGFSKIHATHFEPFAPNGLNGILSGAGFVFVSFGGLLKVASLAEEVKNPGRILPLGMIMALISILMIYLLNIFITVGILGKPVLENTLMPVSEGANIIWGPWGKIFFAVIAIMAFMSAANAGIMGASRYPMALSRDGLLPDFLSRIHERFATPHYSIMTTGALMIGALFLKLDVIVKAASSVLILTYIFTCLALIIMRESRLQNYQPGFRIPLYPWLQIAGITGLCILLYEIGREALATTSVLSIIGLFIYWFYGRIRAIREYALLHIIERMTARELTAHSLETELKEIIRERDEIVQDRFDRVVERAAVLDIESWLTLEDFFKKLAEDLAGKLNMEQDVIFKRLVDREADGSTALSPTIAIPHIVIPGERKFEILLARCKQGIRFSEASPHVTAVFVLIGTRDERNAHLQALASIAQIVQESSFEKKWLTAKNTEALRDLVLLGKRRRFAEKKGELE